MKHRAIETGQSVRHSHAFEPIAVGQIDNLHSVASKICANCSVLSETDKPFCPECGEFFVKSEAQSPTNRSSGDYRIWAWIPLMVWVLLQVFKVVQHYVNVKVVSLTAVANLTDPIEAITFLGLLALVIFIGVKFGKAKSS